MGDLACRYGRSPERGGMRAVIGLADLGSSFSGSGFFDGGLENKAIDRGRQDVRR
jgi:hypothetical protein